MQMFINLFKPAAVPGQLLLGLTGGYVAKGSHRGLREPGTRKPRAQSWAVVGEDGQPLVQAGLGITPKLFELSMRNPAFWSSSCTLE